MSEHVSSWAGFIREVGRGAHGARHLSEIDAERLFGAMLDGEVADLELGALWMAYRIKGESLAELLGFCKALSTRTAGIAAPDGTRPLILPSYNGARRLPNLTPLLALLLAREGVPVLIHGIAEEYGRVTSASVIEALEIPAATTPAQAEEALRAERLAYVSLGVLAPSLAQLVARRARIGVRSSGHTLAKLLDPFGGQAVRVVPVTHPDYLRRMAEFFAVSGTPAIVMRGSEGEPYANPRRMPALQWFEGGLAQELEPQGEHEAVMEALPEMDAKATAKWVRQALAGSSPIPSTLMRQVERFSAAARGQL